MDKIINLTTVEQYGRLYGIPVFNSLINVVDLNYATKPVNYSKWNYGVYALYLKMEKQCDIMYGRTPYDYKEGTVVCFAPGQSVDVKLLNGNIQQNVIGLLFHPDFLKGTSLCRTINKYTYFSYDVNEALHLSEEEKEIIIECLRIMQMELRHGTDKYSKTLLVNHLELLLNYCMRFYERQFTTRMKADNSVMVRFEKLLGDYFEGQTAEINGLPSVKFFADKLCLSPNYFGDLLKKNMGRSPQEYIQEKIIELAKEKVQVTDNTITQIAYSLGFQYPQHFCRVFKKHVGCTPNEYRVQKSLHV